MRNVSFMTSLRLAHRTAMKNLAEGQAYQSLRQWIKSARMINGVEMDGSALQDAMDRAHKAAEPISAKRGHWKHLRKPKSQGNQKKSKKADPTA